MDDSEEEGDHDEETVALAEIEIVGLKLTLTERLEVLLKDPDPDLEPLLELLLDTVEDKLGETVRLWLSDGL